MTEQADTETGGECRERPRDGRRPRVLVLASDLLFPFFFTEETIARLNAVARWERYAERTDSARLRELISQADALITTWHSPFLCAEMIDGAPRLRLIAHCGGEVRARMEEAIFDRLAVTNAPEAMAMPAAEMAMAMTLALVRRLPKYEREMRGGSNINTNLASVGERLSGRRVGIVGFGRIGRTFARLIHPFEVELLIYDPYASADQVAIFGAKAVSLEELLRACSVAVLAAGLTAETRGMLDARRLSLLPDGAYLINVARGGLIDLEALLAELRTGRIAAALDVTDPLEPLPEDHELRQMPNVLLTPHVAAGGIEVRRAMGAAAVEEVARFFRGEKLKNIVTREMLDKMT